VSEHSERGRQWVHIGSAGFAFLLRALTWQQAAIMAAIHAAELQLPDAWLPFVVAR